MHRRMGKATQTDTMTCSPLCHPHQAQIVHVLLYLQQNTWNISVRNYRPFHTKYVLKRSQQAGCERTRATRTPNEPVLANQPSARSRLEPSTADRAPKTLMPRGLNTLRRSAQETFIPSIRTRYDFIEAFHSQYPFQLFPRASSCPRCHKRFYKASFQRKPALTDDRSDTRRQLNKHGCFLFFFLSSSY